MRKMLTVISFLFGTSAIAQIGVAANREADNKWLIQSAQGDLFEVALGQLAQKRGTENLARQFGQKMVMDHTQGFKEMQHLAKMRGLPLLTKLAPSQEVILNFFRQSKSKDWDYDYLMYEVADHQGDISETQQTVSVSGDNEILALARKELNVLRAHLQLAQQYSRILEQQEQ
jgi:putative membrane protein